MGTVLEQQIRGEVTRRKKYAKKDEKKSNVDTAGRMHGGKPEGESTE